VQVSPRPRSSGSAKMEIGGKDGDGDVGEGGESVADLQAGSDAGGEVEGEGEVGSSQPQPQSHSQSQNPTTGTETPTRTFAERVILTPRSIINQLKSLKEYLFRSPSLVLEREEEREIDDALFDIRRQVHAAGLRGESEDRSGK